MPPSPPYDFLIVGGGPVGLHAALKAAVLNHTVLLVDRGRRFSRISQAEAVANIPGRPGVSGKELLEDGREDIRAFERLAGKELVEIREDTEAFDARREGDRFVLSLRPCNEVGPVEEVEGRAVILATGTVDSKPGIERFYRQGHATVSPYVRGGGVGYCILCEGWDVEGATVAVVGAREESFGIAEDLCLQFGGEVTLLTDGEPPPPEAEQRLEGCGVRVETRPIRELHDDGKGIGFRFEDGTEASFDRAFFGLGWYRVNNDLACRLGAGVTDEGFVRTTDDCEVLDQDGTPIRCLYAVGDLRAGRWKQIVVGWGDAEVAVISAYAYRLPQAAERRGTTHPAPPARGS